MVRARRGEEEEDKETTQTGKKEEEENKQRMTYNVLFFFLLFFWFGELGVFHVLCLMGEFFFAYCSACVCACSSLCVFFFVRVVRVPFADNQQYRSRVPMM